jgi:hypothetical protein
MVKNAPDEITLWLSSTQWHVIHKLKKTTNKQKNKKYKNEQ